MTVSVGVHVNADGNPCMGVAILLVFLVLSYFSCLLKDVKVKVKGVTNIAITDENFICATLDWWPSNKCDYNQSFNPLMIKSGGSLQDQIICQFEKQKQCPTITKEDNGFVKFTFSLNALIEKKNSNEDQLNWNPNNAIYLMKYTVSKEYNIDSYELGNERCSERVSTRIDSVQYAKDITKLRYIVNSLYPNATRPKVLGPTEFYDKEWFDNFLQHVGPSVIDGVTHHIYNLGVGVDRNFISKVQDLYFLSKIAQTFKDGSTAVKEFTPQTGTWIGESGGAYNGGGKDVFGSIGALLWHRLMGTKVLSISHDSSPYLRTYAHCSKKGNGITLLLINMEKWTSFNVFLVNDMNLYPDELT
ncbi:hypothetical protein HN51_011157 [Arachis hypogaea]